MQLCKSFHLRPVDPSFPLGIEDDEGDSCSIFTPIAMSSHPMETVIDVAVLKQKLPSCKKKLCHASLHLGRPKCDSTLLMLYQ